MTIAPAACLSHAELSLLGNNVLPHVLRDRRHESPDEPPKCLLGRRLATECQKC